MAATKSRKPGPGRPKGFTPAKSTIEAIKTGMLLTRLQGYVDGKHGMAPSQVTAALGLLKKTIPDLSSVEHKGNADMPLTIITRAE